MVRTDFSYILIPPYLGEKDVMHPACLDPNGKQTNTRYMGLNGVVSRPDDHLPHFRFLLHYNPSSTTPALSVVASGPKPVISQWKEHLARLQKDGDAVVFGYGEFEGKGCVLLCLSDSVA